MKNKAKKWLLLMAIASMMLSFTSCSKQVELEKALKNNSKIKSMSYEMTMKITGLDADELGMSELAIDGKVKKEKDGIANNYSNIKFDFGGIYMEIPIYNSVNEKDLWDFNIFTEVPEVFKELLGEGDYKYLYLSGLTMKEKLKEELGESEFKELEKQMTSTDDSEIVGLSKDISEHFFNYIEKNGDQVKKFDKLEDLSTNSNGLYKISLTKEDFEKMAVEFVDNKDYYESMKSVLSSTLEDAEFPEAEEMKESIKEAFAEVGSFNLVLELKIENKYITGISLELTTAGPEEDPMVLQCAIEIKDINEDMEIEMPDKDDENNADIIDILQLIISETVLNMGNDIYENDFDDLDIDFDDFDFDEFDFDDIDDFDDLDIDSVIRDIE